MVLKAEVGDVVAQAVEKVILAIVMSAEELLRLIHQLLVVVEEGRRRLQGRSAVGCDIHFRPGIVGERHHPQELAGDDGRVHQHGQ